MDTKPRNDAVYKLAWSVLMAGAVILASALALRWCLPAADTSVARPAGNVPADAPGSVAATVEQPAPVMPAPILAPRSRPPLAQTNDILDMDPRALDRQSQWLRAQAAAAEKSEVGPRKAVLSEEQIRELERKKLLLQ